MRRNIIFLLILIEGIIFLAVIGLVIFSIAKRPSLRTHIDVNLNSEQQKFLQERIEELELKLAATNTQSVPDQIVFGLYQELGFTNHLLGNLVEAKSVYQKASKILSKEPILWAALFSVYKDMYDYESALGAVKKSLELNPVDWNLWRGRIELERFQFHASRDDLDKLYKEALEKTENDINIITVYALFLEENGNIKEAFDYWNLAVKSYPENHIFQEEKRRLERFKE